MTIENEQSATRLRRTHASFWAGLSGLSITAGPALVAYAINGKSVCEKTLTGMVHPWFAMVAILLVFGVVCRSNRMRGVGTWMIIVGIAAWIISAPVVGNQVFQWWESQVVSMPPTPEHPLDTLIVLGGGTGRTPNGEPQLASAGDRVMLAARLYHRGCVKRLVTTGDKLSVKKPLFGQTGQQSDPSEDTRRIWTEIKIPNESIDELPGENTSSELRALKERVELWEGKRCGLLTSAFHMPRAIALARREGLDLIPVVADYQISGGPLTVPNFMPDVSVLMRWHALIKETIAMTIKR